MGGACGKYDRREIHRGFLWKERPLVRPKHRWENIKTHLKQIERKGVDKIHPGQDRKN